MSDNKVSIMQKIKLTSYTLNDNNWQLWRKEIVISMRCIDAYEIMTGTEPRPATLFKRSPTPSQDGADPALNARIAQASIALRNAQVADSASPSDSLTGHHLFRGYADMRHERACVPSVQETGDC